MSKQFTLNLDDLLNTLKNVTIFGLPLLVSNLPQVQSYFVSLGISPEIVSILLSTVVKLLEYWVKGDKKTVV